MSLLHLWNSSGKLRLGLSIIFLLVAMAVFKDVLINILVGSDVEPLAQGKFQIFLDPSRDHLLGTDRYGRDVLALVLVGLPNTLIASAIAGGVSTFVGVVVGFVAGYKGGPVDAVLRTITDMFLVIPTLPLIFILTKYSSSLSIPTLALILAIFGWPFGARVIRSQVLSLRERPYVELSKVTNLKDRQIIFGDILPNMLPYIGMSLALSASGAAFALVGLTVVGLGPSDTIELGSIIFFAQSWGVLSLGKWAILFAPMFLLILFFLGAALINQGLEEVYNPRLRGASQ
jgi:peptide/nickel transport system permease protein